MVAATSTAVWKRVFAVALLAISSALACGQGTVFFDNSSGTLPSPPDRLIRFASSGLPATGTNIQVQLYYGAVGAATDSLQAVSSPAARLRPSTTTIPGVWSGGGDRTLNGFPFGTWVTLQVRAWDINDGTTFEAAIANVDAAGLRGESLPFLYRSPTAEANPLTFLMLDFSGFSIGTPVPEPSTLALVMCVTAAVLRFRRGAGRFRYSESGMGDPSTARNRA